MVRSTIGERMAKLETGMDYLKEKTDNILVALNKHIDFEEQKAAAQVAAQAAQIAAAEEKFAPMWVAKVMTWSFRVVGSAILLALMGLIFIKV